MTKEKRNPNRFFHLYHKKDANKQYQFVQSFERLKEARKFAGYLLIADPAKFKIITSKSFAPKILI